MNYDRVEPKHQESTPLEKPVEKLLKPFDKFYKSQTSTGLLLFFSAAIALVLANSDYFQNWYQAIGHIKVGFVLDDSILKLSLHHWVNDGLMVLFFFVIGLEVKRELLVGDLKDIKQSMLVVFMALGGMVFPALVYFLIAAGEGAALNGWGIPMATDTAFALGVLALLGSRAPRSAALLLSALAIIDDIGAVIVIGLFYTESLSLSSLVYAALVFGLLMILNIAGIRKPLPYLGLGLLLWWFVLQSGIHATVAGILTAFAVPTKPYASTNWFSKKMKKLVNKFEDLDQKDEPVLAVKSQSELLEQAEKIAIKSSSPLHRWTHLTDKPVSYLILPVFAFLNAGVMIPEQIGSLFDSTVFWAVVLGLLIGKPIGIVLMAWVSIKLKIAQLPSNLNFAQIWGLSMLAAIGFTMSMFVAGLAFKPESELLAHAKLGILSASLVASIVGASIFVWAARSQKESLANTEAKTA